MTALGDLGRLKQGKELHAKVLTVVFVRIIFSWRVVLLINAKCGLVNESRSAFDQMDKKNSVSWCKLLGGIL